MELKKLGFFKILAVAGIAAMFLGCFGDGGDDDDTTDDDKVFSWEFERFLNEGAKLQDLIYENGKLYAALHFFENWQPSQNSVILELDKKTGAILREFESAFANVQQIAVFGQNLYVLDMGSFFEIDGAITKINLANGQKTVVLDGKTVGADPKKIQFTQGGEAFLLLYRDWGDEYAVKFNLGDYSVSSVAKIAAINPVSDISYNESSGVLWLASGEKAFGYSLSGKNLAFEIASELSILSIKSAGETTVTVEAAFDFSAGKYGVISGGLYRSKEVIDADAICGLANGDFYILERTNQGGLISLDAQGEIIWQRPFSSGNFNPSAICGDGQKTFVSSYNNLTIEMF